MNLDFVVLLFVVTCLREGFGIKCYQCKSHLDPNCGNPFVKDSIESVDCDRMHPDKNATMCRKNVQKVNLGGRSDYRIVRACGWEPDKVASARDVKEEDMADMNKGSERCYTRAGTFEVMVTYCTCKASECNGGHKAMPPIMMGMSMMALGSSAILFMSTLVLF